MRTYADRPSGTISRARSLRRDATEAEKRLWKALREAFPQAKFRRQVPLGSYFADFLSFGAKLVIEVDGGQHAEQVSYDERRTDFMERSGFSVLRVWNNDVLANTDGVLAAVSEALSRFPSTIGRGEGAPAGAKGVRASGRESPSPSPSHAFGAGPSLSRRERG